MHYGCPFWLRREFISDEYPRAVAAYAAEFARRYRGLVRWYTPLNEPLVNSLYCGRRGVWPPYLKGDAGYVRVMLQIVKGVQRTVVALKEVDPNSVMVQVEATGLNRAARHDLEILAVEDQRRGYLFFDLITGLVTHEHPLYAWLLRNGASPDELAEIVSRRIPIEVLGMNFYPQWSTQQVFVDHKGRVAYRPIEQDGAGFEELITDYYERYRVPLMITETSAVGEESMRERWLATSVAAVKRLRSHGVPVMGYTWFPLFTMIDWRYRLGRRPVERYRLDLGLYRLQPDFTRPWQATPLVEQIRGYIADPYNSVGDLSRYSDPPLL
jgi:beta-glucosidase/6-phospho-beta-glucosidase/beta-galactosidase